MSMTKPVEALPQIRNQELTSEKRQFNLIFAAAFAVFLVAFAVSRLLPGSQSLWSRGHEHRRSVFEKARAEADILASFALMR